MLKLILLVFFFLSLCSTAQVTFPWNGTYGGSGTSRTYTAAAVSGVTMSATIVNSENVWQDASPKWFPTGSTNPGGGCSGITATNQGVLLSTDWTSNAVKTITVTISFSTPVRGPVNFKLYDINDDGFGSWADRIVVSGTNSSGSAVNCSRNGTLCIQTGGSVTGNNTPTLTLNSGSSSACTCWGNNSINVGTGSDCVSTVTIQYKSMNTTFNNPKQYVVISNLTAFIDPTCNTILPVELSEFKGACQAEHIDLEWSTASELNNDYFIVGQSEDGLSFENAVSLKGAGTTNGSSYYSSRLDARKGNYFRLTQVDYDGRSTTAPVIYVPCKNLGAVISPNPFENSVSIDLNGVYGEGISVSVRDMNGRLVQHFEFPKVLHDESLSLELDALLKGCYLLEIRDLENLELVNQSKLFKL